MGRARTGRCRRRSRRLQVRESAPIAGWMGENSLRIFARKPQAPTVAGRQDWLEILRKVKKVKWENVPKVLSYYECARVETTSG